MSVVIIGGNECMSRRYVDVCRDYRCKAKVYPKESGGNAGYRLTRSFDTVYGHGFA